jgi:hypothetical protein
MAKGGRKINENATELYRGQQGIGTVKATKKIRMPGNAPKELLYAILWTGKKGNRDGG